MLQARSQLTLQEFLDLALDEGDVTYELLEGQAVPKLSPKKFHSKLTRALLNLIEQWCGEKGEICPELAIALTRRGQDWAPVPELLYLSADRFPVDWQEDGPCSVPPAW